VSPSLRIPLLLAALLLPLGVAACGVKGPLDSPASYVATGSPETEASPTARREIGTTGDRRIDEGNRPVSQSAVDAAPAARKRSALDWLID